MQGKTYSYTVFPNTGNRKGTDEFVVLLSDKTDKDEISQAYRKRWGIEVFFLHCKTNGFNLEDLNFKDLMKVQLLIAVVAVAYVLALLNGLLHEEIKPARVKSVKTNREKKWKSISLFRLGFDNLKNTILFLPDLLDFMLSFLAKGHYRKRELAFSHESVQ